MPPWRLQLRRNTFTRTCSAAAFKTGRTRGEGLFLKMCAVVGAHKKDEVEIWSQSRCVLASSWQKVPSKTCQTAPLTALLLFRASFSLLRCAKLKRKSWICSQFHWCLQTSTLASSEFRRYTTQPAERCPTTCSSGGQPSVMSQREVSPVLARCWLYNPIIPSNSLVSVPFH